MKAKLVIVLAFLVSVACLSAFAEEGKSCDRKAAKSVELTGSLVCKGTGDDCQPIFRVANSDQTYNICHESTVNAEKLAKDGSGTMKITGKIVHCSDGGEELVIEKASKI